MNLLEKNLALSTVDMTREELLMIKNVLYEAYVELGEWEFSNRIGFPPDNALALLKTINNILKSTI
ncbi:MAG TPA: hypothetical protein VEC17_03230 [Candidatus Binatia bacterium]|nr:hypothetical protein [Candidatus Binatia bacterium]